MNNPNQFRTPASRRFLPLSSSSKSQLSSSRTLAAQHTRQSQPDTSSPFVRTQLPQKSYGFDEIEPDHNKPVTSSSLISRVSRTKHLEQDSIEDDNYQSSTVLDTSEIEEELAADNVAEKTELQSDVPESTSSPHVGFSSPLPKRQKTSRGTHISREAIPIPSSPSPSEAGSEFEAFDHEDVEDKDHSVSIGSKFRIRSGANDATQDNRDRQVTRSVFKGPSTSGTSWFESPLPSTFSPSKRKGRYEYTYGGNAETVRGWILNVASEQSKALVEEGVRLRVNMLASDPDGRFDLVNDDNHQTWMLIRQETQTDLQEHMSRHGGQSSIIVKGTGTSWDLEMPLLAPSDDPSAQIRVAVLWEVTNESGDGDRTQVTTHDQL